MAVSASRAISAVAELFVVLLLFARQNGAKCVQLTVFTGGRSFCIQILPGQGCLPSPILGIRKLEIVGYPTVKTASFCVPPFWHHTGVWRTDGRTDGYSVAYTALAKLALRRAVKICR